MDKIEKYKEFLKIFKKRREEYTDPILLEINEQKIRETEKMIAKKEAEYANKMSVLP